MTRILSADLLIADLLAPVEGNPRVQELVDKYDMKPGAKRPLDEEQLKEFRKALEDVEMTAAPGGSSANMLTCLCKMLGKEIEVRFIGMAGDAKHSGIIRQSLTDAGITLVPERYPGGHVLMQSALSYVFTYPDGQCTIATHAGNAREILKPALIPEHLVKNCEVVLVQGSLWHKFHPDFADRLIKLAGKHHRELWVTLPTQAQPTEAERAHVTQALHEATLVFGNADELQRFFGGSLEEGLHSLQRVLRAKEREDGVHARGFITFGKDGAAVADTHDIDFISPMKIKKSDIVNTLGAGDTAYAGFAAGYLHKLPDETSAKIAMVLAGEKLKVNSTRLDDPKAVLAAAAPKLAQALSGEAPPAAHSGARV